MSCPARPLTSSRQAGWPGRMQARDEALRRCVAPENAGLLSGGQILPPDSKLASTGPCQVWPYEARALFTPSSGAAARVLTPGGTALNGRLSRCRRQRRRDLAIPPLLPFMIPRAVCQAGADFLFFGCPSSRSTSTGTGLATVLYTGEYFAAMAMSSCFFASGMSASILKYTRIRS